MVAPQDLEEWSHLRDLPIKSPSNSGSPLLLLGVDCAEVLRPREIRSGGPGEPYGMLTGLGWTVVGPLREGKGSDEETCGYAQITEERYRQPSAQAKGTPPPSKARDADDAVPKRRSNPTKRPMRRTLETQGGRGDTSRALPAQA